MMQYRLFAGLYHESNVPVVSRPRAISLEESSPIRDVHVASRDESEERERDAAEQKMCAVLAR